MKARWVILGLLAVGGGLGIRWCLLWEPTGMERIYQRRTLNIAHRGANLVAPENTLAAFEAALQMGADGVELDVTFSADREVVVIHDDTVDRTTDGSGLVNEMTLKELQALDAGSWFSAKYAEERIPTLNDIFDRIGSRTLINVEVKSISIGRGDLEATVVKLIEAHGLEDSVIISSFNPLTVLRVNRANSQIATGLLYAHDQPLFLRRAWLRPLAHPDALHPNAAQVTPAYVHWAKGKGHRIYVWTVNDPGEIERLIGLGVDAIITDRPDFLGEKLSQYYVDE